MSAPISDSMISSAAPSTLGMDIRRLIDCAVEARTRAPAHGAPIYDANMEVTLR
jgi:hypothetical protein